MLLPPLPGCGRLDPPGLFACEVPGRRRTQTSEPRRVAFRLFAFPVTEQSAVRSLGRLQNTKHRLERASHPRFGVPSCHIPTVAGP